MKPRIIEIWKCESCGMTFNYEKESCANCDSPLKHYQGIMLEDIRQMIKKLKIPWERDREDKHIIGLRAGYKKAKEDFKQLLEDKS